MEPEELEAAVEQAIAARDGDARAAVRALIVANSYLEAELEEAINLVSCGYARGRLPGRIPLLRARPDPDWRPEGTDVILYLHGWDPWTPLAETLSTLHDLVGAGKVR